MGEMVEMVKATQSAAHTVRRAACSAARRDTTRMSASAGQRSVRRRAAPAARRGRAPWWSYAALGLLPLLIQLVVPVVRGLPVGNPTETEASPAAAEEAGGITANIMPGKVSLRAKGERGRSSAHTLGLHRNRFQRRHAGARLLRRAELAGGRTGGALLSRTG